MAISNDRLVSVDAGQVRFRSTGLTAGRWKDSARGNRVRTMTLSAAEFLARFLLHVLPAGFVRIRHFGLLASRTRTAKLARCPMCRQGRLRVLAVFAPGQCPVLALDTHHEPAIGLPHANSVSAPPEAEERRPVFPSYLPRPSGGS